MTTAFTELGCIGDSITGYYITALGNLVLPKGGTVVNLKVSGEQTADMLGRFPTDVSNRTPKFAYTVIMEGANDINTSDLDVATVEANLQACYTLAKNAGITVVACTITPLKGSASYTAGKQAKINQVNDWILHTATDVDKRVDTYTALEDPNNLDALLPAYDSGDHIHPSTAGGAALAQAIYEAF